MLSKIEHIYDTMKWIYNTDVGTFWIKPNQNGRYTLGINSEALGSYNDPVMAADDVYMCATGYWPWDKKLMVYNPTDITEWTQLSA